MRKGQDAPIELMIVRAVIRPQGQRPIFKLPSRNGKLQIESSEAMLVLDFEKGAPIMVIPLSSNEFFMDGGDHTRIAFLRDGRTSRRASCSSGPWQIIIRPAECHLPVLLDRNG